MKRPWFKFYPEDFLTGTQGLSLEERGAYMTLLALMYDRGGVVADDERMICGALDCDIRVWRRLRDRLCRIGKIIPNGDGFLTNRRVQEEVKTIALTAEVRRKSGQLGGQLSAIARSTALKNNDRDEASASILLQQNSSKPLPPSSSPPIPPLITTPTPLFTTSLSNESSVVPHSVIFEPDETRPAVDAWNEIAARQGWAKVLKLTPTRKQIIAARLREHGLDAWRLMLEHTARLSWISDPSRRSGAHQNWQPNIDWFAKASTFLKLMEGAYGAAANAASSSVDWSRREQFWRDQHRWNDAWGPPPDSPDYRGAAA